MSDETRLDAAHSAMAAAPEDDAARLRFYERLADSELFLALTAEAEGDAVTPVTIEEDGVIYAVAFDREDRLAAFAGAVADYAALPGRVLAGVVAEEGLGIALNPGAAPSAMLVAPDAMAWLAQTVASGAPEAVERRIAEIHAPDKLPEALIAALDAKLAQAGGLADWAGLVEAVYDDGARGHVLGIVGAVAGAEATLARAISEALTFSGMEAASLDVGFFAPGHRVSEALARHGLRFELPRGTEAAGRAPGAEPGMDPDKPPRLR